MSSHGQLFVNEDNNISNTDSSNISSLKMRRNNNVCLNSNNDPAYELVSGFDIFCFDKISASKSFSITGRIAAKNSINIGSVTINELKGKDCTKHDFKYAIYTDKLTVGDGEIYGGIHYGSALNIKNYLIDNLKLNKCAISNEPSDDIDFVAIKKRIANISNELAQLTSNAMVHIIDYLNYFIIKEFYIND